MIVKIKVECSPDQGEPETLELEMEVSDPGRELGVEGILALMTEVFVFAKGKMEKGVLHLAGEALESYLRRLGA